MKWHAHWLVMHNGSTQEHAYVIFVQVPSCKCFLTVTIIKTTFFTSRRGYSYTAQRSVYDKILCKIHNLGAENM